MKLYLAEPHGFCAGVDRAIEIVELALRLYGPPIYVRHEIVHNRFVVEDLRAKGAVFVENLSQVPQGACLIFSAHGVSKRVREEAARRSLHVIDATCPLVTKVHVELLRQIECGNQVILIGHAGHPEVEGTMGQAPEGEALLVESEKDVDRLEVRDENRLAYVTQTTLSIDDTAKIVQALRRRFPNIIGPKREDICYATSNRQRAVKELAKVCDLILVIGSKNSSNSNRLCETAEKCGCPAHLIDGPGDIQSAWLEGCCNIGLTAGASAPEILVQETIERLQAMGVEKVHRLQVAEERVEFSLPPELRQKLPKVSLSRR